MYENLHAFKYVYTCIPMAMGGGAKSSVICMLGHTIEHIPNEERRYKSAPKIFVHTSSQCYTFPQFVNNLHALTYH